MQGVINLDFADVETIMKNMGEAIMGIWNCNQAYERAVLILMMLFLVHSWMINKKPPGVLVNI